MTSLFEDVEYEFTSKLWEESLIFEKIRMEILEWQQGGKLLMDREEIIIYTGIGTAVIWLITCVIMEGKGRKYAVMAGLIIDIILFLISPKYDFLLVGILGGVAIGVIPFYPIRYKTAVSEMKGVGNFVVVCIIFCIMILMTVSIANPELSITFG